jgi:coniferyl-aldehyde dehydrogenase
MNQTDVPADLMHAFEVQRAAYDADPFPEWDVRRDRLERLRRLIADNETAIEDAIDADFAGRPRAETQIGEVFPSLSEVLAALRKGRRWMRPRGAWVSKWFLPARAHIVPRPLGVVGIIVPWNYPLYLAAGPLVSALAAGNRAMVKLSEYTPAFSALFERLVAASFKPEEVAVINGGPDIAAQFTRLPFNHLLFTGSTTVGRKVMAAAAENLTPVTLELGGKSPALVAPGYPIELAATRILWGKLLNAGQTCIAPDYVLVPHDAVSAFVEAARARARRMHPAGLADNDYCSIINPRQYGRLLGTLDEARAAGVEVVALFDGAQQDDAHHRLAPQLVVNPPSQLALMRQEIFGPLLPVVPYRTIDEALAFINAQPRPLALYWFDNDRQRTERALKATHTGGVCVNDTLLHILQHELPFGGVGTSGVGHYHGQWGFDTFSKLTPVFRQSRFNSLGLFMPPYKPHVQTLLKLMKRF